MGTVAHMDDVGGYGNDGHRNRRGPSRNCADRRKNPLVRAEALAELAIAAARGRGPMPMFVRERGIVGHAFGGRGERRHLNVVRHGRVVRLVPAVPEVRVDRLKERVRVGDALGHGGVRVRLGHVAIHMGGVEHPNVESVPIFSKRSQNSRGSQCL